jgi:antitoxin FitA
MEALTIRCLDSSVKNRLRIRAAHQGRSMEAEAREILSQALLAENPPQANMAEAIRKRFAPLRGVNLPILRRGGVRPPPDFK